MKHYTSTRTNQGKFKHSFVFTHGSEVTIKFLRSALDIKGTVISIEPYYLVIEFGDKEQRTVNLAAIKYIIHEEFPTLHERLSKKAENPFKSSFVFSYGECVKFAMKDGKLLEATVISEDKYYFYAQTKKTGAFVTLMKSALMYVKHDAYYPDLELNDFYTKEMKEQGIVKPTEYVFSCGDEVKFVFPGNKSVSGRVEDESTYWVQVTVNDNEQVSVFKSAYEYVEHELCDDKAVQYVDNKRLRRELKKKRNNIVINYK